MGALNTDYVVDSVASPPEATGRSDTDLDACASRRRAVLTLRLPERPCYPSERQVGDLAR